MAEYTPTAYGGIWNERDESRSQWRPECQCSRWVVDCRANGIARFDELIIAEMPIIGTPLVGKSLAENKLRKNFGVTVVGIWERGRFNVPTPGTKLSRTSVLVLAVSEKNLYSFDEVYSFYHICNHPGDPVAIVGGGRVGYTIAEKFKERQISYLINEKSPKKAQEISEYVLGDAADLRTLKKAWIEKAPAALVTTHDDATNIYLTKYLRSLRPDMQIISRATWIGMFPRFIVPAPIL